MYAFGVTYVCVITRVVSKVCARRCERWGRSRFFERVGACISSGERKCGHATSATRQNKKMEGIGKALEFLRLMGGAHAPKRLATKLEAMQTRLAKQRVVGSAGGGMVRVTLTGTRQCAAVDIDPSLAGKPVVLQDLTRVAINDAMKLAGEAEAKEQLAAAGEMLTDLPTLLQELTGGLRDGPAGAGAAGRGSHLR